MGATTSQGTGPGSASNIKPLIFNGSVKSVNLGPDSVLDSLSGQKKILSVTASTVTLTAADHAGKIIVLNRAAGVTVTLPASVGNGDVYTIVVGTSVTSNDDIVKVANTSDSMVGRAFVCQDGGNTVLGFEVAAGDDTITLNGGTTGGYAGDYLQLIDIGGNIFLVNALTQATAAEATPFSATV
jgi:hypothetical protein